MDALFGFVPFLTSSSPTPIGNAIFVYEIVLILVAPFAVRMTAKRMSDSSRLDLHAWRW